MSFSGGAKRCRRQLPSQEDGASGASQEDGASGASQEDGASGASQEDRASGEGGEEGGDQQQRGQ